MGEVLLNFSYFFQFITFPNAKQENSAVISENRGGQKAYIISKRVQIGVEVKYFAGGKMGNKRRGTCEIFRFAESEMKFALPHLRSKYFTRTAYFTAKLFHLPKGEFR